MEIYRNKIGIFICLFLLNCQAREAISPTTLRVNFSAEPDTLNPITSSDAYSSRIHNYISDSLIDRDPDTLEFRPELAKSWEVSSDHLVYTFYLREDVTWHDGKPFTADDVLYSYEKIQDPKVEAPFLRVYYADIEKVEKINDYEVRFIFKTPYFLALGICGGIPLVPKHIFEDGQDFNQHTSNRKPVGMGPYRFEEWKTGKKIILKRYDKYWGDKPEIEEILFKIISDDPVALQVLKKGDLDLGSLRPIQWTRQTDSKKFNDQFVKLKYLTPGYNYIGWNNKSPFFEDKKVRQAMTYLIDRKKLLEKLNFGLGEIVTGPFFINGPQYNPNIKPLGYDPLKAKRLLTEAGWMDSDNDGFLDRNGEKFEFTFLYPASSKFVERMATILKEDLEKLGIIMKIVRIEWAAFLDKLENKKFDATSLGWSTSVEGDPYQIWHSSQAKIDRGSNFITYMNEEVDSLIEKARTEFDREIRNGYYYKIQEILHEDQPYTFLYANYSLMVVSKRFSNVIVHKAGLDTLEWKVK